jgi:hypothetical protein
MGHYFVALFRGVRHREIKAAEILGLYVEYVTVHSLFLPIFTVLMLKETEALGD